MAFDFTVAILPGWHSTIFPPYFVAGAIFSGFAMVVTLAVPLRAAFGLQDFITARHLDNMAKVMLATGMIVAYGYLMEAFMAWYGQNPYEKFVQLENRPFGPLCPYLLDDDHLQCVRSPALCGPLASGPTCRSVVCVSIFVNIGMWLERYVIVVTSLHRDFLPSSWGMYHGTFWDYATFYGTLGLFLALMFLFIRFLPVISITEMRELVHETQQEQERRASSRRLAGGRAMKTSAEAKRGLRADGRVRPAGGPDRGDPARLRARLPDDGGLHAVPGRGLAEALGFQRNGIARVVLIGGLVGGLGGFFMQWFSAVVHYPIDVGGRPLQ